MEFTKKIGKHLVEVELESMDTIGGEFATAYPSDPTDNELDRLLASGKVSLRETAQGNNNSTKRSWEETEWKTTGACTWTVLSK